VWLTLDEVILDANSLIFKVVLLSAAEISSLVYSPP
jgi:hypothetical protein